MNKIQIIFLVSTKNDAFILPLVNISRQNTHLGRGKSLITYTINPHLNTYVTTLIR